MTKEPSPSRRLLKIRTAAEYLSMSTGKVRAMVQRGELPVIKDEGPGPWWIDRRDLDLWIERQKQTL